MKRLDASFLNGRKRPTPRIVQFGEGNFLRAFFGWKVDRLNEKLDGDWGIVVVRPIDGGVPMSLNEQDGVYTVLPRGTDEAGNEVAEPRLVACLRKEIPAYGDWDGVLALARDTHFELIVSNTTEAGIAYDPACKFDDAPPATFPAKVTRFLWERWSSCGKADAPGFQLMPCELIDHNADELRRCILQYAADWKLDAGFTAWIEAKCAFYNTLVDRIVTGFPRAEIDGIQAELGYEDTFVVTTELFHLLVVERREGVPPFCLPLGEHDEGTIIAPSADPYKERKVGVLNGAHTGLCSLSLLAGVETVKEAVADANVKRYVDGLIEEEVMPYLSLPRAELEEFAASVLNRFANPFIRHLWYDISLNGISKFKTRNLPRLMAAYKKTGTPPKRMTLSLAAWAAFYLGRFAGSDAYPPRDSDDVLATFARIAAAADPEALIATYLGEASFWGESIDDSTLRAATLAAFRFVTEQPFTFDRLGQYLDG